MLKQEARRDLPSLHQEGVLVDASRADCRERGDRGHRDVTNEREALEEVPVERLRVGVANAPEVDEDEVDPEAARAGGAQDLTDGGVDLLEEEDLVWTGRGSHTPKFMKSIPLKVEMVLGREAHDRGDRRLQAEGQRGQARHLSGRDGLNRRNRERYL